jgi:hypothetical protein
MHRFAQKLRRTSGGPIGYGEASGEHLAFGGSNLPERDFRGLMTVLDFAVTGNFQMDSWFHRAASGPRIRSRESQMFR